MKKLGMKFVLGLILLATVLPFSIPVGAYAAESSTLQPTTRWNRVTEYGKFTVYSGRLCPVRNSPSTSSSAVDYYYGGESLYYDSYVITNGYVWLSYVSGSGTRRYVAWRVHNGTQFGYII